MRIVENVTTGFVRRCERLEVRLARLAQGVQEACAGGLLVPRPPAQRDEGLSALQRAETTAGATSVVIEARADGTFTVSINGRAAIPLSRQLGGLSAVLAAPGRRTPDGLVPFRTKEEIARALKKRIGGNTKAAQIPQAVERLRKRLRRHRENDCLVETHATLGYRFKLRSNPAGKALVIGDEG
jgi:hypothetical protein